MLLVGIASPQGFAQAPAAAQGESANGQQAKQADDAKDWRPLFDGRSLAGWETSDFATATRVEVEDGHLVIGFSEMLNGVTSTRKDLPKVNYEIAFDAMRAEGNDIFAGITFPVGDSHCSLVVGGWGGAVVGLSSLDGFDAGDNETTQAMTFKRNTWYAVRVRVTGERILAWIDDKEVVDVPTAGRKITVRPDVDVSKPLGLFSFATEAHLRNVRLRTLKPDEASPR